MNGIEFFVEGRPSAQPRHRVTRQGGKAWAYPGNKAIKTWRTLVALAAKKATRDKRQLPSAGPVEVGLHFFLPRPKRLLRKSDPDGPLPHTCTPDKNNLVKAVEDAITDAYCIWKDDAQIWKGLGSTKQYCAKGGVPGVLVRIKFTEASDECNP